MGKHTEIEVLPNVFHIHTEKAYDVAALFLRYQEYYESAGDQFCGKLGWSIYDDFMPWYAEKYGKGAFDYHTSWSGFNLPSWVLDDHFRDRSVVKDWNGYDDRMFRIYSRVLQKVGLGAKFYLIGTSDAGHKGDGDTEAVLDHELAHALYYTSPEYKKDVEQLLFDLDFGTQRAGGHWSKLKAIYRCLAKAGYHQRTIRDEVQAYASTGANVFGMHKWLDQETCRPFEENFRSHKKKALRSMK